MSIENELKNEKAKLREILFAKIKEIKGNSEIKQVLQKVEDVNDKLNIHDSKLDEVGDTVQDFFTSIAMSKIKNKISDILDKYDKVDKKTGVAVYNQSEKEMIKTLVSDIDKICNQNFWDRFSNVLSGS